MALALGADASDIQTVAGATTALVSAITYIITEGRVDAASVGHASAAVQNAVEIIKTYEGEAQGDGESK